MNSNTVIVCCASIMLMMTTSRVEADGNCYADQADPDVTIAKLSTVPVWYIQTSDQPVVPCTEFLIEFSVQNDSDGIFILSGFFLMQQLGWSRYYVRPTVPGQYDVWRAEEANDPDAEPLGKVTFVHYDGAGLTMIKCYSSFPDYYYTATAEKVASNDTLNALEQNLTTFHQSDFGGYRYYCNNPYVNY